MYQTRRISTWLFDLSETWSYPTKAVPKYL
jgi:hypothetical protein